MGPAGPLPTLLGYMYNMYMYMYMYMYNMYMCMYMYQRRNIRPHTLVRRQHQSKMHVFGSSKVFQSSPARRIWWRIS